MAISNGYQDQLGPFWNSICQTWSIVVNGQVGHSSLSLKFMNVERLGIDIGIYQLYRLLVEPKHL